MKPAIKSSIFAAATLLAAGTLALPADARTMPGITGVATNAANEACFSNYYGDKQNTSCSVATLQMPLVIDPSGWISVTITGRSNDMTKNMTCRTVATERLWDGFGLYLSTPKSLPAFGSYQNIVLSDGYVPSWGAAYVDCTVNLGVFVHEVSY